MTKLFHIVCTGGGSMGHIFPAVAVMQEVKKLRPDVRISFITSTRKEEQELLQQEGAVHAIHAPKSPRGLSLRWILFPLLFPVAICESFFLLLRDRPSVIFSKGGFVSVPVCLAAWVLRIPLVLHESDSVMGMGNRFIAQLATVICTGFPLGGRAIRTGNPVRPFIAHGSREEGKRITGFSEDRPVILVTGGSQGAKAINEAIAFHSASLLRMADIMHLTGEGKSGASVMDPHYWVKPYVTHELPHLYALADLVITRAGAGSLSELAFLSKPALVIPLEGVAHNHQVKNAEILEQSGAIAALPQSSLSTLSTHVQQLISDGARLEQLGERLHAIFPQDAAVRIAKVLLDTLKTAE